MKNNSLTSDMGGYSVYKHCLVWSRETFLETELSYNSVAKFLTNSSAWMLRNCYDWDCENQTHFWEIICDINSPIELLPSKTRNQIRRSLRDCVIERISSEKMIRDNGYDVYCQSFKRYKDITINIPPRQVWESSILPEDNVDYWGVYERNSGKLIAWARNTIKSQSISYNTLKAIPELMNKHYPYFGLIYQMNNYYLGEKGYKYVSDGWRSITEHSGIQPFLEKNFLFRKAYCKMKVYYKPWLGLIVKALFPLRNMKCLPLAVRNILKFEAINRNLC